VSTWPDGAQGGRPRSATIVIRKRDGGVIGS
jgi:secreted PhoX family phosphatase